MNMKRLSIIIPVYNAEKYLVECLDSIFVQNIANNEYEIIAINDGSTDNSVYILEQYADKYPVLKIIFQENKGVSVARNKGIDVACGKYILFIDSDDFLVPDSIEYMLNIAENDDLDILMGDFQEVYESGKLINNNSARKFTLRLIHSPNYKNKLTSGIDFLSYEADFNYFPWRNLYKLDFLNRNNLRFLPGIIYEDTEFLIRCYYIAEKIRHIDVVFYNYRMTQFSISRDPLKRKKQVLAMLDNMSRIKILSEKFVTDAPKVFYYYRCFYVQTTLNLILNLAITSDIEFDLLQQIKKRDIRYLPCLGSFKQRFLTVLYNISPKLLLKIEMSLYKLLKR